MKKKLLSALTLGAAITLLHCTSVPAEEKMTDAPNAPAEDFLTGDFNNDGAEETLRCVSMPFEEDCSAFLEIYDGEKLLYDDIAKDACVWYVYPVQYESGKTYLCAKSVGDNDFCSNIKLLEFCADGSILELGDAMTLTAADFGGNSEAYLSTWINFRSLSPIDNDKFLASGVILSEHAGVLEANVECTLSDHTLAAAKGPYALTPDFSLYGMETDGWRTASVDFPLYREPGSEEEAFVVKAGEELMLISAAWKENVLYLECENQNGEKGWFSDRDLNEVYSGSDTAYFEEIFRF